MKKKAIEQIENTFPEITLIVFHIASGVRNVNFFLREKNMRNKKCKTKMGCDDAGGYDETFNGSSKLC